MFNGNPEFYNLPRKFKISITGCRVWCSYPEINDVGLTAVTRHPIGRAKGLFAARGRRAVDRSASGPRSTPSCARSRRWRWSGRRGDLRDSDVLRESREKARLKFLFLNHGWNADAFLAELSSGSGTSSIRRATRSCRTNLSRPRGRPSPEAGRTGVRRRGRIARSASHAPAARRSPISPTDTADGELRATIMQNLVIVNVPQRRAAQLERELTRSGSGSAASPSARGTVACTGTEFCKLAITETKGFARWLVEEIEERLPGFEQQLRLHITGCPNSCGQHWIADIGLEGKKIKVDGRSGRLLLLRGRRGGPAPGGGAPDRLPRARGPRARGGGAPAARLPRRTARRAALPRVLRGPHRRRAPGPPGRSRGRSGGAGYPAGPVPTASTADETDPTRPTRPTRSQQERRS